MNRLLPLVFLFFQAFFLLNPRADSTPASCPDTGKPPISFSLDGISLELCTTFIDNPHFVVSPPGNTIQIAYATQDIPFGREFLITAVQYGQRPATELLRQADDITQEEVYRDQLKTVRDQQGGHSQTGMVLHLFGRAISGNTSSISLAMDGIHQQFVRITEWVIKADNHLWIIRASQLAAEPGALSSPGIETGDAALEKTSLTSPAAPGLFLTLDAPGPVRQSDESTPTQFSLDTQNPVLGSLSPSQSTGSILSVPAWWRGVCDNDNYIASTDNPQKLPSYPLGATYRGLTACGPRPVYDHAPDVLVHFFPGAWGELEWECVELSMRFLYLAYGVTPYPANGNAVVPNYRGDKLIKIANGQPGIVPQPDDVLSYCATCTFGHTSVVTEASVDILGNGSITVIEENNSAAGFSKLPVNHWVVSGNSGPVVGWLRSASFRYYSFLPVLLR